MLHLNRSEYIEFLPNLFLKRGKIHQITGSARFTLALIIGNVIQDQITWVRLERSNEILYPEGVSDWITLNNLIMVNTENEEESLWVMEEFLKSGVSSLVFCQLNKQPKYVNLRRLTLSTKRSKEENKSMLPPTGIILSSFDHPISGVESRWSINPCPNQRIFSGDNRFFFEDKWSLICNKSRIIESSWIVESKKFLNGKKIVEVCGNSKKIR